MSDAEKLLLRAAFAAAFDPGELVPRDYGEPAYQWQGKAVLAALRALPVDVRMEAMGMAKFDNRQTPRPLTAWVEARG